MPRSRRAYPHDFREKLMALARSGRTASALAKEFDVSRQTIMNWLKQNDLDAGRRNDGLTSDAHAELTKLRRRVKQLEIDARDFVKKPRPGSRGKPSRA